MSIIDAELVVPPLVVTEIAPLDDDAGTTNENEVADNRVNSTTSVPPTFTSTTPARFVPVTNTVPPIDDALPENDKIVGGAIAVVIVKLVVLIAVPPSVTMEILPVLDCGTSARIVVDERTVKVADTDPNFTSRVPAKFLPVMMVDAPLPPEVALNEVITGITNPGVTVKFVALVAFPFGVRTSIFPVNAPTGIPTTTEV